MLASDYTILIPSEHADKPKFMAVIQLHAQAAADTINLLNSLPGLFDLEVAVGQQLDFVGEWIGKTRYLEAPLTNVYFAWDTPGVGWDEGIWYEPFNPTGTLVRLPDDMFRLLLYAKSATNSWDGTVPGAYRALNAFFEKLGYSVLIYDTGDLRIGFYLYVPPGKTINAVLVGLFGTGAIGVKPAGVRIENNVQSVPGLPFFAFDIQNDKLAGWDIGAWATLYSTE